MLVSLSDLAENLSELLHKKCSECKTSPINRKYTHVRKHNDKESNKEIKTNCKSSKWEIACKNLKWNVNTNEKCCSVKLDKK